MAVSKKKEAVVFTSAVFKYYYCNRLKVTVLLICLVVHFLCHLPVTVVSTVLQLVVNKSTISLSSHTSIYSKYDIIKFRVKTCNNVSEFTHSNWTTLS